MVEDHLALVVAALAELVVPDLSLRVGHVDRRPVVVGEGLPDRVVGVGSDRVRGVQGFRRLRDVLRVRLEAELRRVDADDDEALTLVLLGPGADIAERAEPVDARVRPEVARTTFPRRSSIASGAELIQPVAPSKPGR